MPKIKPAYNIFSSGGILEDWHKKAKSAIAKRDIKGLVKSLVETSNYEIGGWSEEGKVNSKIEETLIKIGKPAVGELIKAIKNKAFLLFTLTDARIRSRKFLNEAPILILRIISTVGIIYFQNTNKN